MRPVPFRGEVAVMSRYASRITPAAKTDWKELSRSLPSADSILFRSVSSSTKKARQSTFTFSAPFPTRQKPLRMPSRNGDSGLTSATESPWRWKPASCLDVPHDWRHFHQRMRRTNDEPNLRRGHSLHFPPTQRNLLQLTPVCLLWPSSILA